MKEAVIVEAVRTPMGRLAGILKDIRTDDLAATIIAKLIEKAGINKEEIEDVYLGCTNQAGEDSRNVARNASLLAGLPYTIPGTTVNRLCGSGLEAINQAGRAVETDHGDLFVAGGVESMTRGPWVMGKPASPFQRGDVTMYDSSLGWRFPNKRMGELYSLINNGETAENVAEKYQISRKDQDEIALASHQKAVRAQQEGRLKDEIMPVEIAQRKGAPLIYDKDEGPRADTSLEKLAALQPSFKKGGTITAGNSSPLSDGAAALLVTTPQKAEQLRLKPLARIVASATAGVHPNYMGIGPIPATQKALKRAGLTMQQIDLVELNEAFASQVLACVRELEIDLNKLNVNGGAIALGHPLGCSGARIMTTLIHEMKRRNSRYGLATMCIGVGQGIATVVERIN
ncbi:MAG: thiolase family protein [Deltaproteobacteria bacterium]|nr:thiolase family protein [Deltaproteobacteria bacterium]MBI2368442.1 thiolase family protein [Deltaproteobacteria bacterium]MBI2532050.1 thiolase family protein [Deltaproteobacteria bacterium]